MVAPPFLVGVTALMLTWVRTSRHGRQVSAHEESLALMARMGWGGVDGVEKYRSEEKVYGAPRVSGDRVARPKCCVQ